jgi:hypothetical protein
VGRLQRFDNGPPNDRNRRKGVIEALAQPLPGPPDRAGKQVEDIGVETMMRGSDYPHAEGVWPEASKYIEEQFAGLAPEIVHKITCENGAKLYRPVNQILRLNAFTVLPPRCAPPISCAALIICTRREVGEA